MGRYEDVTGRIYGKLTAVKYVGKDEYGKAFWICRCECGNVTRIRSDCLTTGNSQTCGSCPVNQYNIIGELAIGVTSSGKTFVFDAEDILIVKKYSWFISPGGYVVANIADGCMIMLHSLLLSNIKGLWVDHISRNKLDNRKSNLRYASPQQNCFNAGVSKNNTTGYKGVYYDKSRDKYQAEIMCSRKKHHLGRFDTAIDAAKAYNKKAVELFGEYAFLNPV